MCRIFLCWFIFHLCPTRAWERTGDSGQNKNPLVETWSFHSLLNLHRPPPSLPQHLMVQSCWITFPVSLPTIHASSRMCICSVSAESFTLYWIKNRIKDIQLQLSKCEECLCGQSTLVQTENRGKESSKLSNWDENGQMDGFPLEVQWLFKSWNFHWTSMLVIVFNRKLIKTDYFLYLLTLEYSNYRNQGSPWRQACVLNPCYTVHIPQFSPVSNEFFVLW